MYVRFVDDVKYISERRGDNITAAGRMEVE